MPAIPETSATQLSSRQRCSLNPGLNLLECGIPSGGSVIGERGEAAVVGGSELFDRQKGCRFENAIANLDRCLHHRVDRIDDTYENKMLRTCELAHQLQDALLIRLTGHLEIESAHIQFE